MSTATKIVHSADSKSLWNYTLAPGWTQKEIEVFVAALKKYGVGSWTRITRERLLPGKTVAQMYNQAQRLVGQQSLAEFQGLCLHLERIFEANAAVTGPHVIRKNNCIVNSGDKITKEEVKRRKESNLEKYGLTDEERGAIVIPVLREDETTSVFVGSSVKGTDGLATTAAKMEQIMMLQSRLRKLKAALVTAEAREAKSGGGGSAGNKENASRERNEKKRKSGGEKKKKKEKKEKMMKEKEEEKEMVNKKAGTTEEDDMMMAYRLQMEMMSGGVGGRGGSHDSDDDFEPPVKRRKGRKASTKKKKKKTATAARGKSKA